MRDIGKNIRDLREAAGMTQEELAAVLFVTRQTVSNYERGTSRPDLDMLLQIANALHTDANTVLYGIPVPPQQQAARRTFVVPAAVFAALIPVSVALHQWFGYLMRNHYIAAPNLTLRTVFDPAFWGLAGWCLASAIILFLGVREQPRKPLIRKCIIGALIGCLIIQLPMVIFWWIGFFRSLTQTSISMSFPSIPVYSRLEYALYMLSYKCPYAFTLVGVALRLWSPPKGEGNSG